MRSKYVPRIADQIIEEIMRDFPALLVVGPRACGKTTTARRFAKSVIQLDHEPEGDVVRADPDGALNEPRPVLLDEWQAVPQIFGAIKRSVDRRPGPGAYLITGSVRSDLEAIGWPLTGRAIRIEMYGLIQREIEGATDLEPLFDRLRTEPMRSLHRTSTDLVLNDYLDLALRGGFPDAVLASSETSRRRWLRAYVDQVATRDADLIDGAHDPLKLRRYLEVLCLSTAGVPTAKSLYDAADVNSRTAQAYDRLLGNLLLVDSVPAWWTNRLKRLAKAPKRYIIDPGVAGAILGVDRAGLRRDGDLLGRMLDTFVASQLRAEARLSESEPTLYHLRTNDQSREVDLLAEYRDGSVYGFEIKSAGGVSAKDARHLAWLRDELGGKFLGGAVLHTGPRSYRLGDRLVAAPIAALWTRPRVNGTEAAG
ncbi:DUF4143 domain-containing protein [Glycomyces sp. L485]|uniref:ATP-binding protein n=1 Tax=Glycomyces sp. L485 TaxID=2909235 RepID=UPI001F4A899E|nr:DUF4143 domain-containing protein [Glycomyces sp. L485]MCH7231876.1 DUF4143 domain-containing protein [Glycomyces sp. L485]